MYGILDLRPCGSDGKELFLRGEYRRFYRNIWLSQECLSTPKIRIIRKFSLNYPLTGEFFTNSLKNLGNLGILSVRWVKNEKDF